MQNAIFSFLKSTRSIAVVIVVLALSIALFIGKVSAEQYITIAMVIISAYFAKRDEKTPIDQSQDENDSGNAELQNVLKSK